MMYPLCLGLTILSSRSVDGSFLEPIVRGVRYKLNVAGGDLADGGVCVSIVERVGSPRMMGDPSEPLVRET